MKKNISRYNVGCFIIIIILKIVKDEEFLSDPLVYVIT